ncbi:MAG: putative DNA binding domain-containing protein [Planctomycetota bacterium]|nr:putative DNA binding domain-containing protein [Planctomycetota bacterium]
MTDAQLSALLIDLLAIPKESEWVEFKHNNAAPEQIAEYLSALSNSAALHGRDSAYVVWGIEDGTHRVVGTTFNPRRAKKGNEELENWLMRSLHPQVDFKLHQWDHQGHRVVLCEIPRASHAPVRCGSEAFIRVGSLKKKLNQDFSVTGAGPMVQMFDERMEITNPGEPLVDTLRFIDTPPRSRNEALAALMRRMGICEEGGSGIDKAVESIEAFQLPAPDVTAPPGNTTATLFGPKTLTDMNAEERIRACYQHCCLMFVTGRRMTNSSLRERLGVEKKNHSAVSRLIRDTVNRSQIRPFDPETGKRYMQYVPFWG